MDTGRFISIDHLNVGVHEVLEDIRACPPAPGHDAVLVPGQWERECAERLREEGIRIPAGIWTRITALARKLGIKSVPCVEHV